MVKQQHLFQMSSQYGELRPTNGRDRLAGFGAPQQISTGFACWLRYCTDVAQWRLTKLCLMLDRLLGCYNVYIFWGLLLPDGILPCTHFTLRPSLAFSYIGSITARHSTSGRQPNFAAWYREWNYRTFVDGATYIRLGGHHVGHQPTSYKFFLSSSFFRLFSTPNLSDRRLDAHHTSTHYVALVQI